jgi:ferredoxin
MQPSAKEPCWLLPEHKGDTAMPMKVVPSNCTGCSACEQECPNDAISEKDGLCIIDPSKCTECIGHYDTQQCVAVCPMDAIVIDKSLPRYQLSA